MSEVTTINLGRIKTYPHSDTISPPEPFQLEDLWKLTPRDRTANWSEMGAKKTSTGLWMIQNKLERKGIEKPSVLIITSKSGKGTFYQLAPHILEDWVILNINTQGISIIQDGNETRIPGLQHVPKNFDFPVLCIAHYNIFSKCNAGEFLINRSDNSIVMDQDGKPIFKEWTQGDFINDREWDFIWCDEAHKLKNREGKWVQNIKKAKSDHRHISTGSGFINRPDEIWSLLNFLEPENFRSYWKFRQEYCAESNYSGYTVVEGIKPEKVQDFRSLVRKYGPRHSLTEVMPHLKEPIQVIREVELSPAQRKMYNSIKTDLKALDAKGVPLNAPNVLAALQRMRQICVATPEVVRDWYDPKEDRRRVEIKLTEPSSKLDAFMDILEDSEFSVQSSPIVVFSNFKGPLELLKVRLDKAKITYLHMKQEDSDEERYRKWAIEFPTGKYRVFMSTLQLGSESINLTPARYLVFLDRSYSPKDNAQGIGRIRRPGQEGQPVVINIEARHSVDQRVFHINKVKQGWFDEIFGDDKN